jgi:cytochrome c oxidase assembly factor CtaG
VAAVDPWQVQADPEWAVALVVAAVDYALVVRTLARRGEPTPAWRRVSFAAGLALIAVALLSPVEHIALTSLLSFHLLQNVMLADWAPPLLVLGLTPAMIAAAERRAWVRLLTSPPMAFALWLAAWYGLHVPAVYGYALEHRWALGLEHVAFLGSGLAFWWAVVSPGRMRPQSRLLFLFGAFIAAAPVAFALAFAQPLYDFYERAPKLWGLSALEDQQIGAITMAVEQAVILFAACSVAFMQWLDEDDGPRRPVGFPT